MATEECGHARPKIGKAKIRGSRRPVAQNSRSSPADHLADLGFRPPRDIGLPVSCRSLSASAGAALFWSLSK
jgi:hypothetical protein